MVMVLKEVQTTNILTPVSTSGVFHSVAAQPMTERTFQGESRSKKEKRMIIIHSVQSEDEWWLVHR
jgi:hypothetical protein